MPLIVTTLRNEGTALLDWVAYHRLIGFTDVLVFSNDCADGTDAMLDRLAAMGVLHHVPNPDDGSGRAPQWRALRRAGAHPLCQRADWIMVADVDEYLVIHPGSGHLSDLFAAAPDAGGFALSWRVLGAGEDDPATMLARLTRAAPAAMVWPWQAVQFKSLYRPAGRFPRLGVHRPQDTGRQGPGPEAFRDWVDDCGAPMRPGGGTAHLTTAPRYTLAQVNHYALGSVEGFLLKRARGRPNRQAAPVDLAYWRDRNFAAVEDRAILRHLPALGAARAALLADAEIARLTAAAAGWRARQIAALLADPETAALAATLRATGPTAPLPMAAQIARIEALLGGRG